MLLARKRLRLRGGGAAAARARASAKRKTVAFLMAGQAEGGRHGVAWWQCVYDLCVPRPMPRLEEEGNGVDGGRGRVLILVKGRQLAS